MGRGDELFDWSIEPDTCLFAPQLDQSRYIYINYPMASPWLCISLPSHSQSFQWSWHDSDGVTRAFHTQNQVGYCCIVRHETYQTCVFIYLDMSLHISLSPKSFFYFFIYLFVKIYRHEINCNLVLDRELFRLVPGHM